MPTVWIVEDDAGIRDTLLYALTAVGFDAVGFPAGEAFFDALRHSRPHLLLLDIMLPGEDGLTILRKLRGQKEGAPIPVIMLTAKGSEIDRVKGLDLGADDYITKPFSVIESVARVRAVLRRTAGGKPSDELTAAAVTLHRTRRAVYVDGQEVPLTFKEFELLAYLMVNEGIVLSRDKLLDAVWGFDYGGESRTVDMHIKSLRQKLGAGGGIIKTVRNVGYKIGV